MPIPYKMNPFGINKQNNDEWFELTVKPIGTDLTYGFTPYWNTGGYCNVDWGDGNSEEAVTSGAELSHTYTTAGTYNIKITAECYHVRFDGTGHELITACSTNLDPLGNLTDGQVMFFKCTNATLPLTSLPDGLTDGNNMFYGCTNATLPLTSLPDGLTDVYHMFYNCENATLPLTSLPDGITNGSGMFYNCENATLPLTSLPDGITNGYEMFYYCSNAEINLDTLVANAPTGGWTSLTDITYMFYGCSKVTGSRSAFLAKCPSDVTGADAAFIGTNTTE